MFVGNVKTLLSREAQEELSTGDAAHHCPAQVNRAVSYHALKERPLEKVLEERQR